MVLTISPENLDGTEVDHFGGLLQFKKGIMKRVLQKSKHNTHLKHSLLWIG
jgi:hypothetical protein